MLTQLRQTVRDRSWPVWVNNLNFFLSDPKKAAEKAQFNATVGNLLEKYGLKDKDQDLAKGQQETAGDPVAGGPDAPEPTPGEEPKRKPRGKKEKDANKGGAASDRRSRRGR